MHIFTRDLCHQPPIYKGLFRQQLLKNLLPRLHVSTCHVHHVHHGPRSQYIYRYVYHTHFFMGTMATNNWKHTRTEWVWWVWRVWWVRDNVISGPWPRRFRGSGHRSLLSSHAPRAWPASIFFMALGMKHHFIIFHRYLSHQNMYNLRKASK